MSALTDAEIRAALAGLCGCKPEELRGWARKDDDGGLAIAPSGQKFSFTGEQVRFELARQAGEAYKVTQEIEVRTRLADGVVLLEEDSPASDSSGAVSVPVRPVRRKRK